VFFFSVSTILCFVFQLIGNIHGGIVGGQPVTIFLGWVMYCLAAYPEVQRECFNEVQKVLNGRLPTSTKEHDKVQHSSSPFFFFSSFLHITSLFFTLLFSSITSIDPNRFSGPVEIHSESD
jgi:hypothetical protein